MRKYILAILILLSLFSSAQRITDTLLLHEGITGVHAMGTDVGDYKLNN